MSDPLLSYFEQELRFIREEASEFAARHPGTADALGFRNDSIDDPQIARLIESIALLNGRLQQRLDDSFPELSESLLRLLYPHYLRQIPAYSMLNVDIDDSASAKHLVPKGTEFEIKNSEGDKAIFSSTKDLTLYPLTIADVNVHYAPFKDEKPAGAEQAKALIEIELAAVDEGIEIAELGIDNLELSLKGDNSFVLRLYDLFFHSLSQICLNDGQACYPIGKQALSTVGFDVEESVLNYNSVTFDGYKLLTEFFMFADKFQSLRVDLASQIHNVKGHKLTLQFYVEELSIDLARTLSKSNFSLYSTPVVNLHKTTTEPITIDFSSSHYPITIDASNPNAYELFSVDKVLDVGQNKGVEVPQIYSNKFVNQSNGLQWHLQQTVKESGRLESSFQVADLANESLSSEPRTWIAEVTCSNGSRASQLKASSEIRCRDSLTIPGRMSLLKRPSAPVYDWDRQKSAWVLLSHLQFNYQAILGADDPVAHLKHIFHLYNHNQNPQNVAYIESVIAIEQEQVVAPIRLSGKSCFAYGTRIEVTLDDSGLNGGVELFANLLDRFFSYFCGFNSFIQLDIKLQSDERVYKRFPRRSGCKNLL